MPLLDFETHLQANWANLVMSSFEAVPSKSESANNAEKAAGVNPVTLGILVSNADIGWGINQIVHTSREFTTSRRATPALIADR